MAQTDALIVPSQYAQRSRDNAHKDSPFDCHGQSLRGPGARTYGVSIQAATLELGQEHVARTDGP